LYYSLASTKNLSQKIGTWGWHPGPGDFGQNAETYPHYDITHNPNLCNFLKSKLEDFSHF